MIERTRQLLEQFETAGERIANLERIDHWGWLHPANPAKSGRKIDLTILALTHGNEVGGLDVLIEVLRLFERGFRGPALNIAFLLANPAAALQNQRQLEADLNRCFGTTDTETLEARRSKELEKIFLQTDLLIDLHQTQGPAARPFFIAKFDAYSYRFIRRLLPDCAMVTYWSPSLTRNGMTTVNYQLAQNGHGFGLELGEKGYCPYQRELGVSLVLKTLLVFESFDPCFQPPYDRNLYTFQDTVVSTSGEYQLVEGLKNFSEVPAGFHLGRIDGKEVVVEHPGAVLFPKYQRPLHPTHSGYDVCRILRHVTAEEYRYALENTPKY